MRRRANKIAADDSQELANSLQDLASVVEKLNEEVETLRQAVDDLREELTYELRKLRDALSLSASNPPYRLTSMPQDPCAEDFGERVNAFDASVFDQPQDGVPAEGLPNKPLAAKTVAEFVGRLTTQSAATQLAAEDWTEDQEFTPDEVVEVDASIHDWCAEYLVSVQQGETWSVSDDGMGWLFLLWTHDERCFVRLLTERQRQEFCDLAGIASDGESDSAEVSPPAAQPSCESKSSTSQQTLW